ncbi:MAG: glycosyltransferase family 2 protein [Candidatus Omnitrophica bacterium]|nr:glycosyltransferase family 2 protein [Candidatus Omnitrophota bacterium]MDD5236996.1 glycosyltransferase family 2 protein [Candidatus Omnitrophota bacterium]MDD5609977.1 glycosyltransferase family 2 protein [Candidatus Omnitrophota bacterium]
MNNIKLISIIIPVFNEEGNIRESYLKLKDALDLLGYDSEVIYINDGSTDSGGSIIKEICGSDRSVKAITFMKNYGQDAALAAGFRHARGDVIIAMDSDLQDDPGDIKLFLEKINEGYDLVCGWRKSRPRRHILREILAFAGNRSGMAVFGLPFHDFNATFKAYRRTALDNFYFFKGFHRFIPVLATMNNLNIKEIEIRNNPRFSGHSKYAFFGLKRVSIVLKDAVALICSKHIFKKKIDLVLAEVKYEISEKYNI